ncbi:hypothetical protein KSC_109740 [Ktedonobacter sp. SOSP1-52]|uniref:hypothetical protein n=1 Tax=Ktedonobacter sp. SOSP1-52 TaxID=2778366 RepID=UPI001915041E|nr:hypothetical protein [Ktedonobacter sp. SOSP1-52]GHO72082.1 hypothetical protein KSC_109740 [Ktedonobacter sp. SOSP1-52]
MRSGSDGEPEIHVGHLSYVSHLCDAFTFLQHVAGEIRRRKVLEAREVCSVTDGAEWCQSLTARGAASFFCAEPILALEYERTGILKGHVTNEKMNPKQH